MDLKNKSAFPIKRQHWVNKHVRDEYIEAQSGMTLRQYYAAKIMQGVVSAPDSYEGDFDFVENNVKWAFKIADGMIKFEEEEGGKS